MDPAEIKQRFGAEFTFWGAGIDTQKTLPFGTPDEVRDEVRRQIETFGPGGRFVFASVHNVQAEVPVENLIALFDAVHAHGQYPLNNQ
jgi:uroporphyrinogen-III decarboxylase